MSKRLQLACHQIGCIGGPIIKSNISSNVGSVTIKHNTIASVDGEVSKFCLYACVCYELSEFG